MFNIILFISTYPVLLIIYFVLKNNHKFHDHLLFSVALQNHNEAVESADNTAHLKPVR